MSFIHDADSITSLLGRRLEPPPMSASDRQRAEEQYMQSRTLFAQNPNLENTIWYGRRLAYLFQYAHAIDIFSGGIARFPSAYQLYRHRGHRYITVRQFPQAIADLEQAAVLAQGQPVRAEADGIPNPRNQPRTSGHFNIYYHLGLAYYLTQSFEQAGQAYESCMRYVDNDDSLTATTDWLYMTQRRLGNVEAAEQLLEHITPTMDIIENDEYHRRLLMYKGLLKPEALLVSPDNADATDITLATQGYGVGNWYLTGGHTTQAYAIFRRVLETKNWAAFGYIASEVELLVQGSGGLFDI